jgi:hypothetical protein
MSSAKQKLDLRNAHIVVGRHFNAGERYASQYEITATAMCKCIVIGVAVVAEPFDITQRAWTEQTRRNECGSWWH